MRNYLLVAAVIGIGVFATGYNKNNPASISLFTVAEKDPAKNPTAPRNVKENVVAYHTGDSALKASRRKAQETLPRFFKMQKDGKDGVYTLKFPLTQNGETEHIWMEFVAAKGDTVIGLLANEPVNGKAYKMGDRMDIRKADIEDWMVRSADGIYGGYSVRAMLRDMPPDQAKKIAAMMRD